MEELASCYCGEREVTDDYRQALMRVARSMRAAGIEPSVAEASLLNRWLAGLKQSPTTRANYRRMAMTLVRYAVDRRECLQFNGRVVRVKQRLPPPVAWSMAELSTLISTTRKLDYSLRKGCPALRPAKAPAIGSGCRLRYDFHSCLRPIHKGWKPI